MTYAAVAPGDASQGSSAVDLDKKVHPGEIAAFCILVLAGLGFAGLNIVSDTHKVGEPLALAPFLFLGWRS